MSDTSAADPESSPPQEPPPAAKRDPMRRAVLIVIGVALTLFGLSIVMERLTPSSSQAAVQAYIVHMAPEVGGRVVEVGVLDNARVPAGTVMFRLDPRPYQLAVAEAEARLEQVGQSLGASTAGVDSAQAKLVRERAEQVNVQAQAGRINELVQRGIYAKARADQAKAALESANANVAAAEAELKAAQEQLGPKGNNNPQLKEALAALEKARLNLAHASVSAPSDGVVTNLQLAPGEVVGAGKAALTFIDASSIWIVAAFKENSLEHMSEGDEAELVLDTIPGAVFKARVESIGWGVSQGSIDPGTGLPTIRNQNGWVREAQRFPVRLVFDGAPPKGVRYGAQANVVVYTGGNPVLNALGAAWIRVISIFTYVS